VSKRATVCSLKSCPRLVSVTLDKNWRIRCSDWEAQELSIEQIDYASKDALVAIELFKKFVNRIVPIHPWTNTKRALNGVLENVNKYVDHKYKPAKQKTTNESKLEKKALLKAKDPTAKETKRTFASRANPLYDNCYMEAPDGEMLCTCDKQKAEWYVMKDLATKVKDEPFTIRLKFEPKGRAVGEVGQYYLQEKENRCVVCGRTESYVRKNVVPREYRKFFPEILKNHTSHDVQLLCTSCHQVSDMSDLHLRRQLTQICNAPMSTQEGGKKSVENPKLKALRNAARALLNNADKIPEVRKRELRERLVDHVPGSTAEEIPEDILRELADMPVTEEYKDFLSHAERVVKYFTANGGLVELEKMWRRHFLDTMKPRFLPNLWSVDHNVQRLEIRADEGRCTKDDLIIAGVDPTKLNVAPNSNTSTPVRSNTATPSVVVTEDNDEKSDTDSNCTLKDEKDLDTDDEEDFASVYQSGVDGSQYCSNSTLASWKTGRSSYHDSNSMYKSDGESTYSFKSCDDDDQTIRDYDSEASDASTLSRNSNQSAKK
jgi:exonuclease 3'-5' domain-containing protein 2